MDSITLQNYRCFGSEEQTARLAPLTLLVGPNNTGKTSFLALLRAAWDTAVGELLPNFRETPYDLGSFQDIVHQDGSRRGPSHSFVTAFGHTRPNSRYAGIDFRVVFEDLDGAPFPICRTVYRNGGSWEVRRESDYRHVIAYTSKRGKWERSFPIANDIYSESLLLPFGLPFWDQVAGQLGQQSNASSPEWVGEAPLTGDDRSRMLELSTAFWPRDPEERPFATAPIRSSPRRTYDPLLPTPDAAGGYVPSYLSGLSRRNSVQWTRLRKELETFGRVSGLFDEISVRAFGTTDGDPFQLQVRKFGRRRKGPQRNLIDVGYGVSQVLPVLVELLRDDDRPHIPAQQPRPLLLQQPEVHLHPSAQAALGTLFCAAAAGGRQLVVETHSDYIIDRVRMDVRDGTTGLKPEDVSILYFEPGDLDVKIHSIRLDEVGNVLDAPLSYGKFFMAETRRSIGL